MKIYKKVFLTAAIVFLNACSTSHVDFHNNKLAIQSGNSTSNYDGHLLTRHRENFATLFIDQKILQFPQGNLIVYEDARTDLQYEFGPSQQRIVSEVFNAIQVRPVSIASQLSAYQLAMPNGQWLNLLAQQSDSQELHLIYGMNNQQFKSMIKDVNTNDSLALQTQVMQLKDPKHAIQSRWTTWKVHFYPLVVPYELSLLR